MYDLDEINFWIKPYYVYDTDVILICPKLACQWNENNLMFRSIVLRKSDHRVISRGFPKFFNLREKIDIKSWDNSWPAEGCVKVDGSCLIISKYNGNIICRTRETIDGRIHSTGNEIELFKEKYNKVFDNDFINSENYSILMEWTTPKNIIVLKESEEPELWLIGIIDNNSGILVSQKILDEKSEEWGVRRPDTLRFANMEECIVKVDSWKDKEGVVIYSPDGQTLRKIKAKHYLKTASLLSKMGSIKSVMEAFIEMGFSLKWEDFYSYVEIKYDYEVASFRQKEIKEVAKVYQKLMDEIQEMVDYYNNKYKNMDIKQKEYYDMVCMEKLTVFQKNVLLLTHRGLQLNAREVAYQLRQRIRE